MFFGTVLVPFWHPVIKRGPLGLEHIQHVDTIETLLATRIPGNRRGRAPDFEWVQGGAP